MSPLGGEIAARYGRDLFGARPDETDVEVGDTVFAAPRAGREHRFGEGVGV